MDKMDRYGSTACKALLIRQRYNSTKEHLETDSVLAMNWGVWELGRQIPEHYHYGFTSSNVPTLEVLHHKSSIITSLVFK